MVAHYLKRGAYNTVFYGLSSVVVRTVSFFLLPFFLSKITMYEFGIWEFYQTFFSLGTMVVSSATATGMVRFYLLYSDNPEMQKRAVGNMALSVVVMAALFSCCAILFFYGRNHHGLGTDFMHITVLNIASFSFFSMVLAYVRSREYLWTYFFMFTGQSVVAIAMTVWGVSYGYGIITFFYANALSYLLFVPFFIYLFTSHMAFSLRLLRQQAAYSIPLLVSGFFYTSFFSVDRLLLKYGAGYQVLGLYSLLWRFGAIFQFFAIALMDAWVIVLFNAQKEKDAGLLIVQLATYVVAILLTGALGAMVVARCAVGWLFPYQYYQIIEYLPLFLASLAVIEVGRILGAGFGLSVRTIYYPVNTLVALIIQSLSIIILHEYQIWGVIAGNSVGFLTYGSMNFLYGRRIYGQPTIDEHRFFKMAAAFCGYVLWYQLLFWYNAPWYLLIMVGITWLILLWLFLLVSDEHKERCGERLVEGYLWCVGAFGARYGYQRQGTVSALSLSKDILYVRTDICCQPVLVGGSVAHTQGVIDALVQKGHKVVVASSAMKSLLATNSSIQFFPLVVWPVFAFLRWRLAYVRWRCECVASNIFFAVQMRSLVKNRAFDYIYHRYSFLNCSGVIMSTLTGVPLILEYNGSEVWAYEQWAVRRQSLFAWLARAIETVNLAKAHHIVVVSTVLRDSLLQRGVAAHKILVAPNGVDTKQFDPHLLSEQRTHIRNLFALQQRFVVGFVGTFSYWHGIEVLASVIPEVVRRNRMVHFILIGDGPLKDFLYAELARHDGVLERVSLVGRVAQNEAKNYLASCDAFICPTQHNSDGSPFFGSPTKLFEYLSMGKPVIASNIPSLAEIVCPSVTIKNNELSRALSVDDVGILVDPEDIQGFVEAIFLLAVVDKELHTAMGLSARKQAEYKHTWLSHISAIEDHCMRKELKE